MDKSKVTTGWPPGLLQDDSRKLFRWFADRVDARHTLRKNLMISEIDITDMKALYDMEHGKHFKLAPQDDLRVPPDSNEIPNDDVYIFMGIDGMYSKCVGSNGVMHHFAAWTKVIPWVK